MIIIMMADMQVGWWAVVAIRVLTTHSRMVRRIIIDSDQNYIPYGRNVWQSLLYGGLPKKHV